jgi:uncharacterized protein (TIGR01777 family)
MKVLITGATGFIGKHLVDVLLKQETNVIAVSRDKEAARKELPDKVQCIDYDSNDLRSAMLSSDAVINLAGDSISGSRWTNKKKASVMNSRLNTAQRLLGVLKSIDNPDITFLQASAIGYYGHREELNLHEESEAGSGFLSEVVQKWEAHMSDVQQYAKRSVTLRIGVVLGKEGGMLKEMLKQSKRGAAGIAGNGLQWLSWIHIYDLVHAIYYLLINEKASGVYNLVAPHPARQKTFSSLLSKYTGRRLQLPLPAFLVKMVLGEMGRELILSGQHVSSSEIVRQGFMFKYETLEIALKDLIKNTERKLS